MFSTSLSCLKTTDYINCFYVNSLGYLTISIFDKQLDLKKDFQLDNNRAYDETNFKKGIFLKNETYVYIFFENNGIIPLITINYVTYDSTNGYQLLYPNPEYGVLTLDIDINLDNNCD